MPSDALHANRIMSEQFSMADGSAVATTFINALSTGLITYAFWSPASAQWLSIWLCANVGYSLLVLADTHSPTRRGKARLIWSMRMRVARAAFLGCLWGALPWMLLPAANPQTTLAIGIIIASMIASGVARLSIIPLAALLFLWSLAGLAGAAIFFRCGAGSIFIVGLLLCYAAFLTKHVRSYSADIFSGWSRKFAVEEANETIALLLSDFQDNASDWLWETDADGKLRNVSTRFREVAGEAPNLAGGKFVDLFVEAPSAFHAQAAFRDIDVTLRSDLNKHWRISGRPIRDAAGRCLGFRGVGSDTTDKFETEKRIAYLRDFDAVTGFVNRRRFREDVAGALKNDEMRPFVTVLSIETPQFKSISDTLGPLEADALLIGIAERLSRCIGEGDVIARTYGGKFNLLHTARRGLRDAADLGEKIVAAFDERITVKGAQLSVGVRVGIALATAEVTDPEVLIRNAGIALSRSGAENTPSVVFFEQGMDEAARRRLSLEQALRYAVANDEFYLVYQPLIDPETGRVRCCEALLRWSSSICGPVSPKEFIPIAEETGLIVAIGEWALKTATRQAMRWPSDILIAVNLSPVQFRSQRLLGAVVAALDETHLPPGRLELEITESTFLEAGETTMASLRDLKALGVKIALDDFGTGYSSLSYLRKFPFDKIKIDKSFVDNIVMDAGSAAIVKAIIDLCAALNMTTTAEGVEHEDQLAILVGLGCHSIQGYICSEPKLGPAIESFIEQRNPSNISRIGARVLKHVG
jgi:diguanylate cyclase (GGDEF)-like protein